MNPQCPQGSLYVFPAADPIEITGEDFLIKDLPVVEGGVDIPSGPPTGSDKEPKVVAEG